TLETCSEKKQKTPEPSSSLGCTSLLPASTSPSQPSNEEPGSSNVTNTNVKANNVELVDDAPIQPPSVTASDESLSTRTFDKDKFRGEFAAAVVEYSERFKSQIEERILTKHCIELCFGKEMRLAEVESVTSGVRNRIAKFLDEYMKKLIISINGAKNDKDKDKKEKGKKKRKEREEVGDNYNSKKVKI
ncbi:17681_t:CDS:2, partial [Gigaspora rosea]